MSQYENRYFTKNKNSKTMEKAKRMASKARAKRIRGDILLHGRTKSGRTGGKGRKGSGRVFTTNVGKNIFFKLMGQVDKDKPISETITDTEKEYNAHGKRFPRQKKTYKEKGGFAARLLESRNRNTRRHYRTITDAAKHDKIEVLQSLLLLPGIYVNHADDQQRTPLYYASSHNNPRIVRYLLSYPGIRPNKPDVFGITPLWIASHLGYSNIVDVLIRCNGINVNQTNMHGHTPLYTAVDQQHYNVVVALLRHPLTNPSSH
jgi:hypothetical protein